ncbi:Non-structural maintenance of chromosomes element 4 [Mycena indigotica]|uniref:Non-structural maintenance of chromosomes element 4 n=1 Tax=Mycena indigotica TaxID=2126181 RepID=A0A8H6WEB7_9AGAR|nr:Non-structural maintenance of chromosomes element 4 [Mycena indigotica]KAF7315554.1 Non-structural maintenance of chromosomes element 4 [Mycena indigotica]
MPADAPYDPDQDAEQRRVVRKGYRNLVKTVQGASSHHSHDLNAEDLTKQIQQADKLFSTGVKGPQEATLDSAFLLMSSNVAAQKARQMKSATGAFDIDDFVARLSAFMGAMKDVDEDGDEEAYVDDNFLEWDRIGRKALAKSRRVPALGFMYGPLSIEVKQRKATQRPKADKEKVKETKPQELHEEDIARSENETTKNVATLETILSEQEGYINLFKFVINPHDFAQSVENIFYLSFLIRDGKVAMETQENGEVMIYSCQQPDDKDYLEGLKKRQLVLEFDVATWKRAKEVFKITESMIPPREKSKMRIGKQWYG